MLDSTLQRQAKDFFQNLTVEVAGSDRAALVCSLTRSAREALGNVALLEEIDKLAARVGQLREPVSGDEVLHVLHRRLLGAGCGHGFGSRGRGRSGQAVEIAGCAERLCPGDSPGTSKGPTRGPRALMSGWRGITPPLSGLPGARTSRTRTRAFWWPTCPWSSPWRARSSRNGGERSIWQSRTSVAGFDPAWLRNAVEEPLDEADIAVTAEE